MRSPASVAALTINWENTDSIGTRAAVITGADANTASTSNSPYKWTDRPIFVLVRDESAVEAYDNFTWIVLSSEKVALASHAFHMVKMDPEAAKKDSAIGKAVKESFCVVLLNPNDGKATVLRESDLKTSKVYGAMRRASDKFYQGSLDRIVKRHAKVLLEQDKLAAADKTLADKAEGEVNASKLAKIKAERNDVAKQLEDLASETKALWNLTKRAS